MATIINFWRLKRCDMRIIAFRMLREFFEKHANSENSLRSWYKEVNDAVWQSPNDVKLDYPSASIIKNNRIIFNIKGNDYRLVVKFNFKIGNAWIKFIGTHAEYDKIDVNTVQNR